MARPSPYRDDAHRLSLFADRYRLSNADCQILLDLSPDDYTAVLDGAAKLSPRHIATIVLFGAAHTDAKASALQHLKAAIGIEAEIWRQIPGYEAYEASSKGQIRKAQRIGGSQPLRVLKQVNGPAGYFKVTLYDADGKMRTMPVHRGVCMAFHGPPPPNHVARHLNGVKTENVPDNLAWGTHVDNAADRSRHIMERRQRGEIVGSYATIHSVAAAVRDGKISRNKALKKLSKLRVRR